MKKNLLILSFALLGAFALYAQTDVTPTRYNFANQPEGPFLLDSVSPTAWNTPASWAPAKDKFNNGYFVIAGGAGVISGQKLSAPLLKDIQTGINVVDLKGQVGKVLVIKGSNSKNAVGTKMGATYNGELFNLNFYGMPDKYTAKTPVRVHIVFSVCENTIRLDQSAFDKAYIVSYTGNPLYTDGTNSNNAGNTNFPSSFFALKDGNGQYVEDNYGNYVYDPSMWEVFEYDINIDDNPFRLKIEFTAGTKDATIFIKEIKFIKDPTGALQQRVPLKLTPGTGLFNITAERAAMRYSVKNGNITIFDLKPNETIRIHNVSGQLVQKIKATSETETCRLNPGFYVVSTENKLAKIMVK